MNKFGIEVGVIPQGYDPDMDFFFAYKYEKCKKSVEMAKYERGVHIYAYSYAAQCIFSNIILCACSQWSRRAENSGCDISSFACNQLGVLSLQSIAICSL